MMRKLSKNRFASLRGGAVVVALAALLLFPAAVGAQDVDPEIQEWIDSMNTEAGDPGTNQIPPPELEASFSCQRRLRCAIRG